MTKIRIPGSAKAAADRLCKSFATPQETDGYQIAAAHLNKSPGHVRRCTDHDQPGDLSFGEVSLLTRLSSHPAAAEHLAAQAGGVFVPLPTGGGGELGAISAEALQDAVNVVKSVMAAESPSSDGGQKKTPAELRAVLAGYAELLRAAGLGHAATMRLLDEAEGRNVVRMPGAAA